MTAPPQTGPTPAAEAWATRVTDWLAPLNVVVGVLLLVGVTSSGSALAGLGWAALAALFCGLIPWSIVQLGIRRGRFADRYIAERHKRPVPMILALTAVVLGYLTLSALRAPSAITNLVLSMTAGLTLVLAFTFWWKISIHTAVAFGAAVVAAGVGDWVGVGAVVAALAVGWSRVRLRAHTPLEVVAGAALGAAAASLVPAVVA